MPRPTASQMAWKVAVEPVKCTPASSGAASAAPPTSAAAPGTRFTTPGGSPAASRTSMTKWAAYTADEAGFQTTVLPMSAGAVGRLPAIEGKLNGVSASTKPSSGRCSSRFQQPGADSGCWR